MNYDSDIEVSIMIRDSKCLSNKRETFQTQTFPIKTFKRFLGKKAITQITKRSSYQKLEFRMGSCSLTEQVQWVL